MRCYWWGRCDLGSGTVTLKVWLRASDYDFELLARMFAVGDTPFLREGARRYLTSRELDEAAESGEVPHERAKMLLSRINGYAVVHDSTYHPIELDNRYTMPGEDEPRSVYRLRPPRILEAEAPTPSVAPVGFDLTETDPVVTDALTLLDRPHRDARWVELYKVLEIIDRDGPNMAVREAAGVSNNNIKRFTRTANDYRASGLEDARHARTNGEPPPNPMQLPEADAMICSLAREWIRQRVEGPGVLPG
jgi:hypothetical protein